MCSGAKRQFYSPPGSNHASKLTEERAKVVASILCIDDIMGKGEEARKYFTKAIDGADTPEHKAGARRAMAMSYAFEGNCDKTIEYEQQVFDFYGSVKNFFQQGEIADEAARVCLDSGDSDTSSKWYEIGRDTGLKEPDIKPARQDLWNFRWEHAQGRIAARRGDH